MMNRIWGFLGFVWQFLFGLRSAGQQTRADAGQNGAEESSDPFVRTPLFVGATKLLVREIYGTLLVTTWDRLDMEVGLSGPRDAIVAIEASVIKGVLVVDGSRGRKARLGPVSVIVRVPTGTDIVGLNVSQGSRVSGSPGSIQLVSG